MVYKVFVICVVVLFCGCSPPSPPNDLVPTVYTHKNFFSSEFELEKLEALNILKKVMKLTNGLGDDYNSFESRVQNTMSEISDDDLYKEMTGLMGAMRVRRSEKDFWRDKRLIVGYGQNLVMLWARGEHKVEVIKFFKKNRDTFVLEINIQRIQGKIDSEYTDKNLMHFKKKGNRLKLSNVFVNRLYYYNGSPSDSYELELRRFLRKHRKSILKRPLERDLPGIIQD